MPIDFVKVESLRRHMLLTVDNIADFFGVSRQTYYSYLKGKEPRTKREAIIRSKIRTLLSVMTTQNWPMPEVIAADQKVRYQMLLNLTAE